MLKPAWLARFSVLLAVSFSVAVLQAQTLRVMTFNVRYPSPDDGPNRWDLRKDLVVDTIRGKAPDLVGTQELFSEQGQYIVEKLPEYAWFGLSRRGNREDEHMGVFYKKDRLRLVESGNFWLSETPETPGSMSWSVSLPRMATWGLFELPDSGRRFYFFNTHFPHRREDDQARLECARVLAQRISRTPGNLPLILTGDFNAAPDSAPYAVFAGTLKDARLSAERRIGPDGTNSGFAGSTSGRRIDWIFYRGGLKAVESETIVNGRDGRFPSDHFPVLAVFEFQESGAPDQAVARLYDLVSASSGSTPDWNKVRDCFVSQAAVVLRTSRNATTVFSLDGFIKDFVDFYEKPFVRGTTTLYPNKSGFTEKVLKSKSWEFRDMAQVLVLYEASIAGDSRPAQRGIDNWLLSRRDGRWLVVAVTNELVTPDHPVPPELQ
jgi:endonuclease/exonuclease/phosphatase family metal-dependent hydrolase